MHQIFYLDLYASLMSMNMEYPSNTPGLLEIGSKPEKS